MNKVVFAITGAAIGLLIITYFYTDSLTEDAPSYEPEEPDLLDEAVSQVKNLVTTVDESLLLDANIQAFLILIRTGEGTLGDKGYRTMFGGSTFSSYADHPRTVITRSGLSSTAAGAFQFLSRTWDEMASKYDLPDFSPASQDIAALGLIKRRGALQDVIDGRFKTAIKKCNKEWASLPDSPYGQPTLTYAKAQNILVREGAIITENLA